MALLAGGRTAVVLAGAGSALVLATAPALATVWATTDIDTVIVEGDGDDDFVAMSCDNDDLVNVNGVPADPALACGDTVVVLVDPGDGVDQVNLGGSLTAFPQLDHTSVELADGQDDTLIGSEARDVVTADIGDTALVGSGDDWVAGAGTADGGEGDDTLRDISTEVAGGPGDDRIVDPGADSIDGGAGFDTVVEDFSSFTKPTAMGFVVTDVSLGPAPGVGQTTAGIEAYDLTSSAGPIADTVDSSAFSGRVVAALNGGDDGFQGGPGVDVVDAGSGADHVDAGPANDVVHGGAGDDTISARDGFADVVDCGDGTDSVVADRSDQLLGCENVAVPPPETTAIAGHKRLVRPEKALFTFASPVASAVFECQLDGQPFQPCSSPFALKSRKLAIGRHTLSVRAVQPVGNPDPTPSTFRFKVKEKGRAPQA